MNKGCSTNVSERKGRLGTCMSQNKSAPYSGKRLTSLVHGLPGLSVSPLHENALPPAFIRMCPGSMEWL